MTMESLGFNLEEEIARLWKDDAARSGRAAWTLVKHPDLRIVLTVVRAGNRIAEHKASGRVSVHTVQGHIRMHVSHGAKAELVDMPAGHVLVLDRDVAHDVEAVADSAFLLTIAWPAGTPA